MLRLLPSLTVIATLAVAPVAFAQSAIAPDPVAPSAGKSLARTEISPLNPSRRRAITFRGIVSPRRSTDVQTNASRVSFFAGGPCGITIKSKSGVSLRITNR